MKSFDRFEEAMQGFGWSAPPQKIAVAVSGGGDSMALCLLLQRWAQKHAVEIIALTVDHGLRAESAREAEETGRRLAAHGIQHRILTWSGLKPKTGIQEQARIARYALLAEACRDLGCSVLALAHNLEDQIETFWMRLAHGSGLDGLSGMASLRKVDGLQIIRPVLSFDRATLREICRDQAVEWLEDPSNENEKYLRVRLRQFEQVLAEEGLSPARLVQTVQKLEDARQALTAVTARIATSAMTCHAEGYVTLDHSQWRAQPLDIRRRLLMHALQLVSPATYDPGHVAMGDLCTALEGPDFRGRTLAGCEILRQHSTAPIMICREYAAIAARQPWRDMDSLWDGRFALQGGRPIESVEVGALGAAGVQALRKSVAETPEISARLSLLPAKVQRGLPALWQGENILCVPHVSFVCTEMPQAADVRFIFQTKSFAA